MKVTGEKSHWEYTADELNNTEKITVQWKYDFSGMEALVKTERPRRTGFNITWYVQDGEEQDKGIQAAEEQTWTSKLDFEAIFITENAYFVAFVNMAQQALEK